MDENKVATDDPQANALIDLIRNIQKMQDKEEKIEGFSWDDDMIAKKKKAIKEEEDWK